MRQSIIFVTGTSTGVGKTVFTTLLARWLHAEGLRVAALKPIASGSRSDARRLRAATGKNLSLDHVNPWHFNAPVTPLLAARLEQQVLARRAVLRHIRRFAAASDITLVEGAGGLLSPLGSSFDSRSLIRVLAARVIVVAPNRLGTLNQTLLTFEALPRPAQRGAIVVLVDPKRPDSSSATNPSLLSELLPGTLIARLPWLARPAALGPGGLPPRARNILRRIRRAIAPRTVKPTRAAPAGRRRTP